MQIFKQAVAAHKENTQAINDLWNSVTDSDSFRTAELASEEALDKLRKAFFESTKTYNSLSDCMKFSEFHLLQLSKKFQ
jgi:hypothetical protein